MKIRTIILILIVNIAIGGIVWQLNTEESPNPTPSEIFLNQEEKRWLQALEAPLKIGITHIPNQVILENNTVKGFSIDVFKEIEKSVGITFDYVSYETWNQVISAVKSHDIDIVFLAQKTEKRHAYLHFTDTVLSQQNKIIVRSDTRGFSTLEALTKKRVAVVDGSAIFDYLHENYPTLLLVPVVTEREALKLLTQKHVDASICEPVRTAYYMELYDIQDLKVGGDIGYNYNLRIASRNDLPILNVILSKAVEHLSSEVKQTLALKWGYIKESHPYLNKEMFIYIMIAFGIILPFAIYLYWINFSLTKEIRRRKEAEQQLNVFNRTLEEKIKTELEKNRKQQTLMLQQSRFAQMGEMISMIAHQWRQPLNSLGISVQVLEQKYYNAQVDDDYMQGYKEKSMKLINHMSDTIDDFRSFFKPQKEKEMFSLIEVVDHAIDMLHPLLIQCKIEVIYENKTNVSLLGYKNEVGQAVINILNNAKDALLVKEGETKKIMISFETDEKEIYVTIGDNGGGISDDIIDKIFDPYFSTKENRNGTGLGLYMTKIIIEEHCKGRLLVENSTAGALFTIVLPLI